MPISDLKLIKPGSMRDKDPSLTLTLRTQLGSNFSRRFKEISADSRKKIVNENFFSGIKKTNNTNNINSLKTNQYSYPSSPSKIAEFLDYIQQMIDAKIFERIIIFDNINSPYQLWSNTYIKSAYQRGLEKSQQDLSRMGFATFLPEASVAAASYFALPVHIDALNTVYIRMFESLKGITSEMSGQISSILTKGIAEGRSPLELARLISNRIDKIGITRAKRLARTEIVRAYNVASINNYELLDLEISEDLMVQWWTALDERVRSKHRVWHGDILTFQQARERIGEPNCRCAVLPYIESINSTESLDIPYEGWITATPEAA